jgi:hypothetical protein
LYLAASCSTECEERNCMSSFVRSHPKELGDESKCV